MNICSLSSPITTVINTDPYIQANKCIDQTIGDCKMCQPPSWLAGWTACCWPLNAKLAGSTIFSSFSSPKVEVGAAERTKNISRGKKEEEEK